MIENRNLEQMFFLLQSSVNPNMPLRGLMYFSNLYDQYIKMNGLNIYGRKLQKIPTPKYIVFYNGEDNYGEVTKLRLSDAFMNQDARGEFEWTATVYNLNEVRNEDLLGRCRALSEYMELVNRIRKNQQGGMEIREAVDEAIESCIADGIMKDFLMKHRAEVLSVCITEFDEKVYTDGIREEGREEGREQGMEESMKASALRMLKAGKYALDEIAEISGLILDKVKVLKESNNQKDTI